MTKKAKKIKTQVKNQIFGAKVEIDGIEWFCLGEIGRAVEGRVVLAVRGSEPAPAAIHMIVIAHDPIVEGKA